MKSSPHRWTCCCVSFLMCYAVVHASLFDLSKPHNNILVDGPATVLTSKGQDVDIVKKGGTPPTVNSQPMLPRSESGVIVEEDNSITGFLRRAGAKLFGRKQADSKTPMNFDPTNLSLPELFSTLASMPASKFDKIADQLIAETFGMGSVLPAPPGFLGGLGLPALPSRGPAVGQDPRRGSASNNIASIVPALGMMSPSMHHAFAQSPPPQVHVNSLPLSTVVFPVFVPKDQPLPGHRSLNHHNHNNNSGSNDFMDTSTPNSLDVTQAASHNPLFAFPPPPPSHHHQQQHHPHHQQLQMDQSDMSSLVRHNGMRGSIAQQDGNLPPHHQHHRHPLESLSSIVHSGFLHEINKLSQPFPLSGNRNSATQVSSPAGLNGERGNRHEDRWFADQASPSQPAASQGRSDTRSIFLPSPSSSSSSSLSAAQLERTIMESTKSVVSTAAADGSRRSSSSGTAYPILDTSSSTPTVYHAPHNPVDILKIFATAYEAARSVDHLQNPSLSSSSAGNAVAVNHLHRASSDKDAQSTKKVTTKIASFPVFLKDDSASTSMSGGTRGDIVMRPRKFVTYLS